MMKFRIEASVMRKVYTLFWQLENQWCWYCSACGHTFVTDTNPSCSCGRIHREYWSLPVKNPGPTFLDIGYFYCPYVPLDFHSQKV